MTPPSPSPGRNAGGRARALGAAGEKAAAAFLRDLGYDILRQNYRTPLGEIDLVARDGDCLVFAEVKTGRAGAAVEPHENYTPRKAARVFRAALAYLQNEGYDDDADFRFDLLVATRAEGRFHFQHYAGLPLDHYCPELGREETPE